MKLFSSESVSEGHPDKIADQISDAVLDHLIQKDQYARVACETLIKTGMVLIAGEITTNSYIDMESVVRNVLVDIGYNSNQVGMDASSCAVLSNITKQSPEITHCVNGSGSSFQGAGDQGTVFGFACDETPELMPLALMYAHKLMKRHAEVRKRGTLPWLYPDAKTQITVKYDGLRPVAIEAIVLSTQHMSNISRELLIEGVMEEIIIPVIPEYLRTKNTKYLINPAGTFIIGGPMADCGVTGRKIIVDTYGGAAHHGGGAFSGKDPSKVDRSAAYMARYLAKNIVKAGLATKCEIQISYSIGIPEPVSFSVYCYGTNIISEDNITKCIAKNFSLTPLEIISRLCLLRPIYRATSCYGHFGREESNFTWEKLDITKIFDII